MFEPRHKALVAFFYALGMVKALIQAPGLLAHWALRQHRR